MVYQHITIRDFKGGWNTVAPSFDDAEDASFDMARPGYNRPDLVTGAAFPQMLNLFVTYAGRLQLRPGQHRLFATPRPLDGMARYYSPDRPFVMAATATEVLAYDVGADTLTHIASRVLFGSPPPWFGGASPEPLEFVTMEDDHVYWAAQGGPMRWAGSGPALRLGLDAPQAPVTVLGVGSAGPAPGAGNVGLPDSGTPGAQPYQYFVTDVNSSGDESNPSPPSAYIWPHQQAVAVSDFPAPLDPSVVSRNLYRTGGTSAEYRLVANLPLTTASYNDDTPDPLLSPTQMSFAHDRPPDTLTTLYPHKNRLLGLDWNAPQRLWLSSFGQPAYWPRDVGDPLTDGGFIDVPGCNHTNPLVAIGGTGSLAVLLALNSVHVLLGDSWDDFVVRRISQVGCVAARSAALCNDRLLFLGKDGMVYALTDAQPEPVALPIETTLRQMTTARLAGACACYHDQRYLLFVPPLASEPNFAACFDFRSGAWTDLSDGSLSATACAPSRGQELYGDVLLATAAGYKWQDYSGAGPTDFTGVVSAFSPADAGAVPIFFKVETPAFEFGRPNWTNRLKSLRIEGTLAGEATATIRMDTPGGASVTRAYALRPGDEDALLDVEVGAALVGRRATVIISGVATQFEATTIDLAFSFLRPERK